MQSTCCRVLAMLPVLRRRSSSRDRDAEMPAMKFPICMTAQRSLVRPRRGASGGFRLYVRLQSQPVMHKGLTKTRSAVTACLIFARVVALKGPIPTVSALKRDMVAP